MLCSNWMAHTLCDLVGTHFQTERLLATPLLESRPSTVWYITYTVWAPRFCSSTNGRTERRTYIALHTCGGVGLKLKSHSSALRVFVCLTYEQPLALPPFWSRLPSDRLTTWDNPSSYFSFFSNLFFPFKILLNSFSPTSLDRISSSLSCSFSVFNCTFISVFVLLS